MNREMDCETSTADLSMIKRMIPHRYPFLMIDRVEHLEAGAGATGVKNVTINEPHFQGHFPDQAVMPGVAIVEAMAQTSAVLVSHSMGLIDKKIKIYLMAVDRARFRKMVVPGDVLRIPVQVLHNRRKIWKFKCLGMVDDTVAAEAEITALWQLESEAT